MREAECGTWERPNIGILVDGQIMGIDIVADFCVSKVCVPVGTW